MPNPPDDSNPNPNPYPNRWARARPGPYALGEGCSVLANGQVSDTALHEALLADGPDDMAEMADMAAARRRAMAGGMPAEEAERLFPDR